MNIDNIVNELDRLYEFDTDKYVSECNYWKSKGYRIFRNSEGKHKVVVPQDVNSNANELLNKLYEACGYTHYRK